MAESGWWDHIPEPEGDIDKKAEKLANVLSPYPGPREFKVRFCKDAIPQLEAAADVAEATSPKARSAFMRATIIRYYRHKLREPAGSRAERDTHQLKDTLRERHGDPNEHGSRDHRGRPRRLHPVAGRRDR